MAVLLQYNITTDLNPSTEASGVSGSICANGSLTTFQQASEGYASDPTIKAYAASSATTEPNAITQNSYFDFTVTPDSGKKISLTTLTFNSARGGAGTPRGYGVRSSKDSYAASLGNADLATVRPNWSAISIDLSGVNFQEQTAAITFRIYVYAFSTASSIEIDDIIINGTVEDVSVAFVPRSMLLGMG